MIKTKDKKETKDILRRYKLKCIMSRQIIIQKLPILCLLSLKHTSYDVQ